jgi:putative pre-16S rRNA nuclease
VRALGVDLGSRRIGVAVSDSDGRLATPIEVVDARDRPAARRSLADLVAEWEAEVVVVGLPLSLDGSEGPAARAARREAEELAKMLSVPVEVHDERLTTAEADRVLMENQMKTPDRRKVIDKVAASVMLQSWLDQRREPAGE